MSVTNLLQQLVSIPSVNPENDPGTVHTGEAELAEFLAQWLRDCGAEVTLEEVLPNRPNLIARFAPVDGRPRILFGPHMDTVGVGGMEIEPFAAKIHDDRLWGRGASDTKGSMAAMLWALREHAAQLAEAPTAIDFVAFMGEESAQHGSRHFAEYHADDYEFAIVGEPTGLDIVHATKGSMWATLQCTGKAAHSSQPENGINAILQLVEVIQQFYEPFEEHLKDYTHSVLGHSTINLGTIRGGTRPNIVPDRATAEIDVRTTPALKAAGGALKLLRETLAPYPVEITAAGERPPMETPAKNPWIQRIREIHPTSHCAGAPWFSDAGLLAQAGLPAVCIGPGSITQAHTANEFILVSDLEYGAAYFSKLVKTWTQG